MMPEVYAYLMPEQPPLYRNAIRKVYRILNTLCGYQELPMFCRHDFSFLKRWIAVIHPTAIKAQLILRFLTPAC